MGYLAAIMGPSDVQCLTLFIHGDTFYLLYYDLSEALWYSFLLACKHKPLVSVYLQQL